MRVLLSALFCLTLSAQNYSVEKELAMGRELARVYLQSVSRVESQELQDFVAQFGARLAVELPNRGIPFTFTVHQGLTNPLRQPTVFPGGQIFVPLDLILAANDEGEFAAMLAQAMARARLLGTTPDMITIYSTVPVRLVQPIKQMPGIELQADAAAVQALSRASLDPAALLRYIERLQPADPPNSAFNALPPRDARITALQQLLRDLPPAASGDFVRIQELARPKVDTQRPTLRRFE